MPQSTTITDIDLPDAAFHPSADEFSHADADRKNTPNSISSIEQYLRVAIAMGGRHKWRELAEQAIEYQKSYEEENVFSDFVVDTDPLDQSDDVWLTNELGDLYDSMQAQRDEEQQVYERRMHWYDNTVLSDIQDKVNRATTMLNDGVEFTCVTIVDGVADGDDEMSVDDLAGTDIREFEYKTPITLVVCISSDSGSVYPFMPWYGTTACSCPYKHDNPVSTLCKHEIAALIRYSEDQYSPTGRNVPERFKRLMNPDAYNTFKQDIL